MLSALQLIRRNQNIGVVRWGSRISGSSTTSRSPDEGPNKLWSGSRPRRCAAPSNEHYGDCQRFYLSDCSGTVLTPCTDGVGVEGESGPGANGVWEIEWSSLSWIGLTEMFYPSMRHKKRVQALITVRLDVMRLSSVQTYPWCCILLSLNFEIRMPNN